MTHRVLLISHEPEAEPARIGAILRERGYEVVEHVVLADPAQPDVAFPEHEDFDMVGAFGSFANAYDERHRPWVEAEIELLDRIVSDGTPYLGVCFGGQLLAESLGGRVERSPSGSEEVGVVRIDPVDGVDLPSGPWFSWHEDRVVLPADGSVEVLATNDNAVQVFRSGRAVGLQFHPEADVDLVAAWASMGPDHVPHGVTVAGMLGELDAVADQTRENCERLVDWFLRDIAHLEA